MVFEYGKILKGALRRVSTPPLSRHTISRDSKGVKGRTKSNSSTTFGLTVG